jgi:DNA polymerase III delta prime subunit
MMKSLAQETLVARTLAALADTLLETTKTERTAETRIVTAVGTFLKRQTHKSQTRQRLSLTEVENTSVRRVNATEPKTENRLLTNPVFLAVNRNQGVCVTVTNFMLGL